MEKLTALRAFRRVAELGSFTRAAKDLRMSNAAASKNVRELEEELGVPLVHRTTRRLNLTPAGQAYYERCAAILDELTDADRTVKDLRASPRGVLRVSAPMSFGLTSLMPAVSAFLERWPELRVELELNDRFVDPIREGFDVCLRGGTALDDSSLVARRLTTVERVLVSAPAARPRLRSPVDLVKQRCLVYSLAASPAEWTFVRGKTKKTVTISGPLRVNNSLALVQAAASGAGIALVPSFAVRRELEDGRLVRLLDDWTSEPASIYAIAPRHREMSRGVRLFVDHLAGAFTGDERSPRR
jgi:DNA-binding transcriptional LysR family regulator